MADMVTVRPRPDWDANPENENRTVLCEMDDDHPDGQVNINQGDGETPVAMTEGVIKAIGEKRLEVVSQPREARRAEPANERAARDARKE